MGKKKSLGPSVSYTDKFGKNKSFRVSTYREVRRRMGEFLEDSDGNEVSVYRRRRGEWGEWFEHWGRSGRGYKIRKEGWC